MSEPYEFDSPADYEVPYWEPSNVEDELKVQLGETGVLDVSADNIKSVLNRFKITFYQKLCNFRLLDELGSGEFGVVRRGVWSVGTEEREVAVKSLADGSKRIQFLQEAAIMGQFKHPNVITLHGVLLDQEPVSNEHMTLLCNFHTMHNTIV